jgi:hypothetical protein
MSVHSTVPLIFFSNKERKCNQMVESKPNRKFLYIEDNGDGTSTMTLSIPEIDVFESAVLAFGFEEMFNLVLQDIPVELRQTIADNVTTIPNFPGG